jgi:hypothetical protein
MNELRKDVLKHWNSFRNPLINDILTNIEKLERNQNVKPPSSEDEDAIAAFIDKCEKLPADKMDPMKFIHVANQMPATYMLYIIHKLQALNGDLIMKIISYAQKHKDSNEAVGKFFQRNMVFEKAQLLGRIFSTNRMESVLSTL